MAGADHMGVYRAVAAVAGRWQDSASISWASLRAYLIRQLASFTLPRVSSILVTLRALPGVTISPPAYMPIFRLSAEAK